MNGGGVRGPKPSDSYWEAAAEALSPEKSLARIDDKAKQLVGGVGLVGALLGGGGLVASQGLVADEAARRLAVASSVLAFVAVTVALGASLLRFDRSVPHRDLKAVRAWYERQFRRAQLVVVAGVLLLIGVALAAATAIVHLASPPRHDPSLMLTAARLGDEIAISTKVDAPNLEPGSLLSVVLVANPGRTILARGVAQADDKGEASVSLEAKATRGVEVELVSETGRRRCVLRLGETAATSQSRCTAR